MPSVIDVRQDGAVREITLSRPERRNALNSELHSALVAALYEFDADPGARVAILTGADPAFCAGMDLTELGTDRIPADSPNTFGRALRAVAKPVIGAINGPAITGGLEIALGCDFLIASDRAYFADTHAAVGVFPGGGMTVLLAEAVGLRRARQLSFTGAFVDAERAFRDGLVNEVMPHQELLPRARAVAAAIAEVDSDLLISLRASYRRGTNMFADNALRAEQAESAGRAISVVDVASVKDRVISLGARTLAAKDSMPEASPFSQPGF